MLALNLHALNITALPSGWGGLCPPGNTVTGNTVIHCGFSLDHTLFSRPLESGPPRSKHPTSPLHRSIVADWCVAMKAVPICSMPGGLAVYLQDRGKRRQRSPISTQILSYRIWPAAMNQRHTLDQKRLISCPPPAQFSAATRPHCPGMTTDHTETEEVK